MKPNSLLSTIAALTFCVALWTTNAPAASTIPANPYGERYLFVVDKSSDLERLQDATEATIFELIGSGLYGQMRPGDTFGAWTFNKEVSSGRFPMQVWDSRKARQQATMVAAYISGVEYEGSSSTKELVEKVTAIVHSVSNVTVFVISDGDAPMKGTPFDKTINGEYKRLRKQRASAKRPFVTTLIARDGWILDHSVTIAGTPIELPPRTAAPERNPPAPVKETNTTPAVASAAVQAPPPSAPKPAPKITIITKRPVETNAPVPAQLAQTSPAIVESQPTDVRPTVATPPSPTVAPANPAATPAKSFEIASQESILTAAASGASAAPAENPAAKATVASSSTMETMLAQVSPGPVSVAAREMGSGNAGGGTTSSVIAVEGMGMPVGNSGHPVLLIGFGATMFVATLALGFMVLRQRRPTVGASLITRSMEQR